MCAEVRLTQIGTAVKFVRFFNSMEANSKDSFFCRSLSLFYFMFLLISTSHIPVSRSLTSYPTSLSSPPSPRKQSEMRWCRQEAEINEIFQIFTCPSFSTYNNSIFISVPPRVPFPCTCFRSCLSCSTSSSTHSRFVHSRPYRNACRHQLLERRILYLSDVSYCN